MLGPAIFTVMRAVAPPVIWMMLLPAKSCMPHPRNALLLKAVIQPDKLQMQHITTAGFVATSPLSPRCHLVVCRRGDASATVRRPLSRALRHVGSAVLRCHEVPRPNVDALHPAARTRAKGVVHARGQGRAVEGHGNDAFELS